MKGNDPLGSLITGLAVPRPPGVRLGKRHKLSPSTVLLEESREEAALSKRTRMKSTACLLAAFGVIANLQTGVLGADTIKRSAIQPASIRPPIPIPIKPSPGFISTPPRAIPRPGYLTKPPPPTVRTAATRSLSQYSAASSPAGKAGKMSPTLNSPSFFSAGVSGFRATLYPAASPAGQAKPGGRAAVADSGPLTMEVNLQRLVRYFENSRTMPGRTNSSTSFKPPVKEADLSKMLAAPGEAKHQSGAKE